MSKVCVLRYLCLGAVLLMGTISSPSFAELGPSPFHVLLSSEVRQDSNANRSSDSDDRLSETQTAATVNVNGQYDKFGNMLASMNYRWSETGYQKDSQLNDPTLTGDASLSIGGRADFYLLSFTHTSTQLLVDPTAEDNRSNRDNRDTYGASLTFKSKPTRPNQVALTLSRMDTRYDEIEFNNTERLVSQLSYTRQMTPLNSGGVQLSLSEITYPSFEGGDYDNTLVYLYFRRQLRMLNYYFAVGLNQTSSLLRDDESPYAQFNIQYLTGVSTFSLALSRTITDNSIGLSSTQNILLGEVLVGGGGALNEREAIADGSLNFRDQIERDSAVLTYGTPVLCSRCRVNMALSYREDHYINSIEGNAITLSANLGLVYRATTASNISLGIRHTAFEFTDRVDANNYEQNSATVSWGWLGKSSLNLTTFFELIERNHEQFGSYSGNEFGFRLSYQLM